MKSECVGLSRALVWVYVGTLIMSGPGQTLALVARGLDATPPRAAIRSGRSADLAVRIDTQAYAGQRGRILMRLRADGAAPGALRVRWTARHSLTGGVARSGERAVVAETATLNQSIDDVMTFEVQSRDAADARIDVRPEFEFETADGHASRLTATGADGEPLHVVLTPSQTFAGVVLPAARWAVRSAETEPMPAGIQVTSSGVRLQRDFANTRVTLSPEFSDQYGFAFKGAVGRAVSSRAAFGLVGGGGRSQSELVANFGWQVTPSQRLLVSGGSLQQDTELVFDSGMERRGLRQSSGGAAYSLTLAGKFQPRFDSQGYFASSPSQDLGSLQYFREADGQAQIFRQDRRVAGVLLTGAQTHASFAILPTSTLTVSLGAERLRYVMATGDESTTTLTRGVEWAQQLSRGYAVQGLARTQAAMHTTGVGIERAFRAHGQRLGVTLTKINGRNGVADDLQLRLTHTMAFGSGTRVAPQARVSGVAETDPLIDALLNEVSQRPSFLPLVSLAKVDRSRGAERLVAVDRAGMVPGTRINEITGTVSVPTGASIITGVTRNGVSFSNNGQFSATAGELQIHPMAMETPVTNDQYLVSMQRPDNGLTTVVIDVTHGSVHITRVTVTHGEADTTPDAFSFSSPPSAPVNTAVASASVAITGLGAAAPISITGGEYSLDGGPFTSTPGTIRDGQAVVVRVMTPAGYGMTAVGALNIGGVSAKFTVSSEAAVSTPAAFTFAPRNDAELDSLVESDAVVMTGMNVPGAISISGGEYRVNGGAFTSAPGEISSGDTVRVRVRSSAAAATLTSTTLSIGGLGVAFVATTAAAGADTTPDAFTFAAETGAARSTAITSAAAAIAGMNAAAPISITGGEYSIDGGPFTSTPGTISAGRSVRLRLTSAAGHNTTSSSTVTIGGISSAFTVTTVAEPGAPDTTPDAFGFTTQNALAVSTQVTSDVTTISGLNTPAAISTSSGSRYSIDNADFTSAGGTITNGQTVQVRLTTSSSLGTATTATVTIGGVDGTFSATTVAADTTPNAFTFTTQDNLAVSTEVTSNSVAIAGLNTSTAISVSNGEYSIMGGTFTSAPGTIAEGENFRVRLTTSSNVATAATVTLIVGGVTGTFTANTVGADTTPDAFAFTGQKLVAPGTVITSNTITVGGINTAAAISITGGEYSIDSGGYTSGSGSVNNAQTVTVRQTASSAWSTLTTATLNIGGVQGDFVVMTDAEPVDTTPDAFTFTAQTGAALSTTATSNIVTVGGVNAAAAISITGGTYSVNSGSYTSAAATVTNGQTVTVRLTSSPSAGTTTSAVLTIGGVAGAFDVTTLAADTTPDAFSFAAQTGVAVSTVTTSNTITVGGINSAAAISITGGTYSVNSGGYTSAAATVTNGQTVTVRLTSSPSAGTTTSAVLTIGGVAGAFDVTTLAADTTPDAFSFAAQTGVAVSTVTTSNTITVGGINSAAAISITGGTYSVNSGGYTSAAATVTNGQTVTVRLTSSPSAGTTTSAVLTIGGVAGAFDVTTLAADTTPDAFSFAAQTGVAVSTVTTSNTITVGGINSAAAISITGGTYSVNSGSYTSAAATVTNGQTVTVRLTSSPSAGTTTSAVLTIGGVAGAFDVTTLAADTTPDAFSFTSETDVNPHAPQSSNIVTITGISPGTVISVSGTTSEYKLNNSGWTAAAGTLSSADTVQVRHTAPVGSLTVRTTTLTIGTVTATYTTTNKP